MKQNSMLLSKDGFPKNWGLTVRKVELDKTFPIHCHDFFEIEIIIDGEGIQELNGKTYFLKKGDAYILRPTDFHSVRVCKPMTIYNIMFDGLMLSNTLDFNSDNSFCEYFAHFEEKQFDIVLSYIEALLYETQNDGQYKTLMERNLLEFIMINIIRNSNTHDFVSKSSPLRQVISYLNRNYKLAPSLEETSKIIGFAPTYFSSWFHKNTGKTYIEYLNSLRLSEAKKLLLTTSQSVTEICFACGFKSFSGFLKEFKKEYSVTPATLRKNLNLKS